MSTHGVDLRVAGLFAQALDTLLALDRAVPAHPLVVIEIARAELPLGREADAIQRLRAMRTVTRDSVAGSHELADALEKLGRPREAAEVAAGSWAALPMEERWAQALLLRLAPADGRAIGDLVSRAAAARPWRPDLQQGAALVRVRTGRAAAAIEQLAQAEPPDGVGSLRREFADRAVMLGTAADSAAALAALVSAAGAAAADVRLRFDCAQRALDLAGAPPERGALAARLADGFADLDGARWDPRLLVSLARELRESGRAARAEALLARTGGRLRSDPAIEFERLLAVLREGPPERTLAAFDSLAFRLPSARFMRAEAYFFAGRLDSALASYGRLAADTAAADGIPALDRAYLLEAEPDSPALRALGALAYAHWRGDSARARSLSDSLWHSLPRTSAYYSAAAMQAYEERAAAGAWREALVPLAAIGDSLPDDRLAPLARQRAGEAWLALGEPRQARAQFEECLARYPRAWNSAEVRRLLEPLRKGVRL